MKVLATLIVLAFAGIAQAYGEITYDWPSVNGLAINNACATATTFKSLTPVTYCTETKVDRYSCRMGEIETCRPLKAGQPPYAGEYLKEDVRCVAYGTRHIEVSRTTKTTTCTKWAPINEMDHGQCLEWGTVETLVGVDFSVATYRTESAETGPQFIGYTTHTVPNCKK